ncbi:MAG: cupredoxin domain-containing protein, partial [Nitrososphaeraceae archaeon]
CRSTNKPDTLTIFVQGHLQANTSLIMTALTMAIAVIASISTIITFDATSPVSQKLAFAQGSNESSSSMIPKNESGANLTNTTKATTVPTLTTPGVKEFYLFTAEIPDVDEEKLKVAGDAFSIPTMIVNKGDNVTVHFYNVDPVTDERHSFTIGAPYNVDADIAFGESDVVSFMADYEGIFQYYCKYHLPVMTGQLQVVP